MRYSDQVIDDWSHRAEEKPLFSRFFDHGTLCIGVPPYYVDMHICWSVRFFLSLQPNVYQWNILSP